ncbi:hypothetical protein [Mesorhizobium sp.]|uniref:hypothetical protein n=1 Tax=Mesorhizobium sp. TaxID=1871066 RepID=UPI00257DD3A1|nr:hypothetical protein [Mesorhizobium sp.]
MALAWPGKTLAATPAPLTRTIPSTGEAISAVGLGTWINFKVGDDPVQPGGWFYATIAAFPLETSCGLAGQQRFLWGIINCSAFPFRHRL